MKYTNETTHNLLYLLKNGWIDGWMDDKLFPKMITVKIKICSSFLKTFHNGEFVKAILVNF